jgi:hypothetical protein
VICPARPQQIALADAAPNAPGEQHILSPQPADHGAGGADVSEHLEQHGKAVPDLAVGVPHDSASAVVDQAHGQRQFQLATPRLVQDAALQARLQDVQFGLAHRALQTEQ